MPRVPRALTQATTLDELQQNPEEVLELCCEEESVEVPHSVGTQHIEIEA